MKRSDINPLPQYWDRYINLVPDVELPQAFDHSIRQLQALDTTALVRVADKTYSPGKWTVKDIVQHLTDVERIMCYRALLFARRDGTIPLGFEQDLFAINEGANRRTLDDLIDVYVTMRRAAKTLCYNFDTEMMNTRD